MSEVIRVRNASGRVVSFEVSGPSSGVRQVLEQQIARGELERVDDDATHVEVDPAAVAAAQDQHAGVRDEAGNLLTSVHGGGLNRG